MNFRCDPLPLFTFQISILASTSAITSFCSQEKAEIARRTLHYPESSDCGKGTFQTAGSSREANLQSPQDCCDCLPRDLRQVAYGMEQLGQRLGEEVQITQQPEWGRKGQRQGEGQEGTRSGKISVLRCWQRTAVIVSVFGILLGYYIPGSSAVAPDDCSQRRVVSTTSREPFARPVEGGHTGEAESHQHDKEASAEGGTQRTSDCPKGGSDGSVSGRYQAAYSSRESQTSHGHGAIAQGAGGSSSGIEEPKGRQSHQHGDDRKRGSRDASRYGGRYQQRERRAQKEDPADGEGQNGDATPDVCYADADGELHEALRRHGEGYTSYDDSTCTHPTGHRSGWSKEDSQCRIANQILGSGIATLSSWQRTTTTAVTIFSCSQRNQKLHEGTRRWQGLQWYGIEKFADGNKLDGSSVVTENSTLCSGSPLQILVEPNMIVSLGTASPLRTCIDGIHYAWKPENRQLDVSGSLDFPEVRQDHHTGYQFCYYDFNRILENRQLLVSGSPGSLYGASLCGIQEWTQMTQFKHERNVEGCTLNADRVRSLQDVVTVWFAGTDGGCTSTVFHTQCSQILCSDNALIGTNGNTSLFWHARIGEGCTSYAICCQSTHRHVTNEEGCTSSTHIDRLTQKKVNHTYRSQEQYKGECHGEADRLLQLLWYLIALQSIGTTYLYTLQVVVGVICRLCFLRFDKEHAQIGSELVWQIVRGSFWIMVTMVGLNRIRQPTKRHLQFVGRRRYSLGTRLQRNPVHLKGVLFAAILTTAHAIDATRIPSHSNDTTYSEDQGSTVAYQTVQRRCISKGIQELRIIDKEISFESVVDRYVYPLPNTIGEAMQNPRRLRLLHDWEETVSFLVEHGFDIHDFVKIETFGLKEYDIGRRSLRSHFISLSAVLQAVEQTWHDAIAGGNFQVFMIVPQPIDLPIDSVGFLVEIYTATVDIDHYAPILFEYHTYNEGMSDISMVQRTDYLARRGSATEIYSLAAVTNYAHL